jgi:hypothetical protein
MASISGSIQGLFRVYSGSIQGLFRVYSGSIQGLFRVCSGSVQGLYRVCSGSVQGLFRVYSASIQHLFSIYSASIQHLFSIYSASIQHLFSIYSAEDSFPVSSIHLSNWHIDAAAGRFDFSHQLLIQSSPKKRYRFWVGMCCQGWLKVSRVRAGDLQLFLHRLR